MHLLVVYKLKKRCWKRSPSVETLFPSRGQIAFIAFPSKGIEISRAREFVGFYGCPVNKGH